MAPATFLYHGSAMDFEADIFKASTGPRWFLTACFADYLSS
jgi:hypothetical protein